MRRLLLVAAFFASSCGGSPTAPTPNPNPQPTTVTVSGRITTTLTSEPVAGASVSIGGRVLTTTSDGRWTLDGQTRNVTLPVEVSAPGYLTRSTAVRTEQGRSDVPIDLIREGGEFSLDFYRQMVRNGFTEPGSIAAEPLRRWTKNPKFFIYTLNPKTGAPISDDELSIVEAAIRSAVPDFTGGLLSAESVTSSFTNQEPVDTVRVEFSYEPESSSCGQALVGSNPGRIRINYGRCGCGVNNVVPWVVWHEVGHAMGFRHTATGLMRSVSAPCGAPSLSAPELYHARIAYSRQPGNMDIDRDGSGVALLSGLAAPVVQCFR